MPNQSSIILVPFPFSDQTGTKVRPALILSNPEFNRHEDVIICALTSSIKERPYSLIVAERDTLHKKLKDKSQIRIDTITRIKKSLIIKEIDILTETSFQKVLKILHGLFQEDLNSAISYRLLRETFIYSLLYHIVCQNLFMSISNLIMGI